MKRKSIITLLLLGCLALPAMAQMVSNNNDDEVNRVDSWAGKAYREGQVIVKFKADAPLQVKRSAKGKFQSAGINEVDKVLNSLAVTTVDELMPLTGAIKGRAPRRAKALSGRQVIEPDLSTLFCLKFEQEGVTVEEAVETLKALPEVEYAEPNYLVYIQSTGTEDLLSYINEPMYNQQWGLNAIKLPQLWAMDKVETERPVIAILDTGVDITHPDLKDNIWTNASEANGADYEDDDNNSYVDDVHGWDFVAGTPIIGSGMDRNGHGTHCAGIAAAVGNNSLGIVGANPDAIILPIKVMGDDGTGDVATICRGIDYATACKAHVLSMSFGGGNSAAEYQALSKALTNYAVLCGAAGNSSSDINVFNPLIPSPSFPGAYDIVLGVMASDSDGQLAGFSNYDPDGPFFSRYNMDKAFSTDVTWNAEYMWNYDVMAPGVNIMSTYLNGSYKSLNGTSMATPMVAGAISRILQVKGYDYARDYGLMGDMAMAKDGSYLDWAVFDALKAASFDESNREVALALTALEIDDSEGDGDCRFDAGEVVNIWPTIRSLWGHAENIKIGIEPYDENTPTDAIEVLDNNVDFGWSLNSRGSFKSQNPIRVKVNENAWDGMHLPYKIVITSDNLLAGFEQEHVFEVENGIELGGVINEDMVLYPNKHYIVTKSIAIPQGKTLTIMPGTRLEFNEGCYIKSEGLLIATGKPDSLIVFTTREGAGSWGGIRSHRMTGYSWVNDNVYIYTNADTTLFTLAPTEATPVKFQDFSVIRYVPNGWNGKRNFSLAEYLTKFHPELCDAGGNIFMNGREHLLTEPDFITAPVLALMQEWRDSIAAYPTEWSEDNPNYYSFFCYPGGHSKFQTAIHPCDTIAHCRLENVSASVAPYLYARDCIFTATSRDSYFNNNLFSGLHGMQGRRNNFVDMLVSAFADDIQSAGYDHNNFVNFINVNHIGYNWLYSQLGYSNLINSGCGERPNRLAPYELRYMVGNDIGITTDHADYPSWLGTGKEEIIRPYVYDSQNPNVDCFTTVDLSNMPKRPIYETHGIVWKVVVDGYDAQDEFDMLPPLGVGRHKFEVYYNRDDMDTTFTPTVSMGLREPYTQTPIAEGGYWSVKDSASVYTVFLNITGKTNCDGLNRIYVTGGKDYDHFDIPDEKYRFNVLVQAAGSMATGFAAEAGLGSVKLTWNNENNDFDDAMGFNVYRFQLSEENDTINRVRLNETILDIEATEFTDYEVTPGETYYYYYKVLSTDLKEYDISNVVAATPLTSTLGDANASGSVDVADVITTVNYAAGMDPKPFIFGAADVNVDEEIDILDVIGIIKIITHPNSAATASVEAVAEYSVEDGIVYVDCPVDLAGVQLMLTADREATITTTEALNGFEQVGAWMDETSYLFMAYNMAGRVIPAGKHAILNIADADITDIRLSDKDGHNILAVPAVPTVIDHIAADQQVRRGVYDLMGRKVANDASALPRLQPGIYIVNGSKVVVK